MQDPTRSNISGEKVEQHVFEHRIDWGQVALGLALLYLVYQGARLINSAESDTQSDPESDDHLIA